MSFTHAQIWGAIDDLARRQGISPSAMARLSGLDPTAFNPSKRQSAAGRLRWPSTESIARLLDALDMGFDDFARIVVQQVSASGDTESLS